MIEQSTDGEMPRERPARHRTDGHCVVLFPAVPEERHPAKGHPSSRVFESSVFFVRQIKLVYITPILTDPLRSRSIASMTHRARCHDAHNRNDIAHNHYDGTTSIRGRLVREECLGTNDVSGSPRNVEPCEQEDFLV
jgi:hypothetical protein